MNYVFMHLIGGSKAEESFIEPLGDFLRDQTGRSNLSLIFCCFFIYYAILQDSWMVRTLLCYICSLCVAAMLASFGRKLASILK